MSDELIDIYESFEMCNKNHFYKIDPNITLQKRTRAVANVINPSFLYFYFPNISSSRRLSTQTKE